MLLCQMIDELERNPHPPLKQPPKTEETEVVEGDVIDLPHFLDGGHSEPKGDAGG
jgi:hypothetical protein